MMEHTGTVGAWEARLLRDDRRVFVLDDDPTGTQTTSGTDILLRADTSEIVRFIRGSNRGIHILTNTRAFGTKEALSRVEAAVDAIHSAYGDDAVRAALVLRGDSTLRGHTFDEIDAIGGRDSVALFVPALPQVGRVTIGGIQWVIRDDSVVPVRETEYADDPVFGYRSESLSEWVEEVGGRTGRSVPLTDLRSHGSAAVADALESLDPGDVLLPDAASVSDLRLIATGLLDAEEAGADVVVRSAAAFASIRYGAPERDASKDVLALLPAEPATLVVCGSHTVSSTRQLAELASITGAELRFLPTAIALGTSPSLEYLADEIAEDLTSRGIAVLATERRRRPEHLSLDDGARVMASLMALVETVASDADLIISKGGITSAAVAPAAWGSNRAHVMGQIQRGIPAWKVTRPDGRDAVQIVVAGNVGGISTLSDLVRLAREGLPTSDRVNL